MLLADAREPGQPEWLRILLSTDTAKEKKHHINMVSLALAAAVTRIGSSWASPATPVRRQR